MADTDEDILKFLGGGVAPSEDQVPSDQQSPEEFLGLVAPKSTNSDLVQGLVAGTEHMANLVENQGRSALYGILNKVTGDPDYQNKRDEYFNQYLTRAKEIEEAHPRNVQDFASAESVGDYVDVLQRDVAEGLPMLLGLAPAALLAPEAGVGAIMAAAIPDTLVQTLASDAQLKENNVDSLGAAFLMGSAKHAVNYLGKVQALQRIFGSGLEEAVNNSVASKLVTQMTGGKISEQAAGRVGDILTSFAQGGAQFAVPAMAQTAIDQAGTSLLAENKDFFTKENTSHLLEAGAAGFLTGGLLGGGHRVLKGTRGTEELQLSDQTMAEQEKAAAIIDVGTATKYFTDRNLDPTVFSSEEGLIKAANRLKDNELKQQDVSPALRTLYQEPEGKPKLLTDRTGTEAQDVQEFFAKRAQELHNQAILAQPESQNLVSRGIAPEDVVKMRPEKIAELSERINKSYDAVNKQELDQYVADSQGNISTQKTMDVRQKAFADLRRSAADNAVENQRTLKEVLQKMKTAFMPGDGVVISPTANDAFLGRLQDAYDQAKAKEQYKNVTGKEPTVGKNYSPMRPDSGDKTVTPQNVWQRMGGKKSHPLPETAAKMLPKEEPKLEPSLDGDQYELPILEASRNEPTNDSRVLQQDQERTVRNIQDSSKTREQKLQPMTAEEAQLHRSTVMPNMIYNNLKMSPPRTEFHGKMADVVGNLGRIAKEVGGPHVKFMPVDYLHSIDPYTADPVSVLRGAQIRNMIFTSLEHINNPNAPLSENVLHEVWHMLANDTNVFSASDKKLLEIEHPKIVKFLKNRFDLPDKQLDLMDNTPAGRDEIQATAFGLYANDLRTKKPMELNSPVRKLFHKALNIVQKFGNYLRGAGFRTYEDLFTSVNQGERQATASNFHADAMNEMRQARLQQIGEQIQKNHMEDIINGGPISQLEMDAAMKESMKEKRNGREGVVADQAMAVRNRWFRTAMGLAHKYEAWRIPVQMGIDLQRNIRQYSTRYASMHEAATRGYSKPEIENVHNLMDKLASTGQSAKFEMDKAGNPNFDKMTWMEPDGKAGISTDKKFNRLYFQTREQFRQVNNDYENPLRNILERHGLDRNIPIDKLERTVQLHQKDYQSLKDQLASSKQDAKNAATPELRELAAKQSEKLLLQVKDKERWLSPVEDILENLKDIDARRGVDYVPHMRFGPYGISVYAKADLEPHPTIKGKLRPIEGRKAVYFGTVERASFGQKRIGGAASAKEHANHLAEIKRMGLAGDNYVVFGKDSPFFLDKNAIGNELNNRMVTLDLMYGLMHDKNMEAYVSMMEHLKDQTALKGFARHFSKRENIPGYSKDWTRSTPKYLTGAANFIGRREAAPELTTYQAKVQTQMEDPHMKKDLLDYLNYMNNPSEDYLGMREINYLWALGMNPVSAILQAATLPTSTHMSMNTYNPAPIKNAMYIGKWFKKAMALSGHNIRDHKTGTLLNDFSNRKVIDDLISKKFFHPDAAKNKEYGDFFHLMANSGHMEGFYRNELVAKGVRGTDTKADKAYHMANKISNYAGTALGFMETATRIATVMAHYDMIRNEKAVMDRANRVLKDDKVYQAMLKNTRFTPEQTLALFGMDEAHAVFSKAARGTFQRGIAGVLMPFTQYPVQTLEYMGRQLSRGPEGRAALAMNLGALMVMSGALGLPGANIMKDAAEAAYKKATGHNVDLEELVREKAMEMGATPAMSAFLTQGFSSPILGMDLGKRIGFGDAIPMADLLLSLFGIRGNSVLDSMGVQGSIIKNATQAWDAYNSGQSGTEVAAKLMPSAISNALQGYNYGQHGVRTAKGDTLIPASQVTPGMQLLKGIGITPGKVADARENLYFTKMKENEWTDFISQNTRLLSSLRTQRILAAKEADKDKADEYLRKEQEVISSLRKWQKDTGYPLNFTDMNATIRKQVQQNITGKKNVKDIKKVARKSAKTIERMTSLSGENNNG